MWVWREQVYLSLGVWVLSGGLLKRIMVGLLGWCKNIVLFSAEIC
jgi:hypothetical protein